MYQESNTSNSGKKADLLLFVGLVVLLIVARIALNIIQSLGFGILQLVVFIGLIAVCFIVFKKRFCTYRYTLFHKEPEEGELDAYGNQQTLAMPLGTFIIEQMSGSRGGIVANIGPGDMLQLIPPSAATIGIIGSGNDPSLKKPPLYGNVKNGRRENAHILLYRADGKTKALAFCPSKELEGMLNEIIAAVNA